MPPPTPASSAVVDAEGSAYLDTGDYIVRRGTEQDIATLAKFNCALARETEDIELDQDTVVRGVTNVFAMDGQAGHYYVAVPRDRPDEVIGQLMVTFEWRFVALHGVRCTAHTHTLG